MPPLLQNIIVALAILASAGFLSRQLWASLAGKKSKIGQCCSHGCGHTTATEKPGQTHFAAPTGRPTHFIPLESLARKRH